MTKDELERIKRNVEMGRAYHRDIEDLLAEVIRLTPIETAAISLAEQEIAAIPARASKCGRCDF